MSDTSVPKPLSAYVGLLVASLEEARAAGHSTAGQVVRLPLAAAGQLLTARSRYDDLAQTGDMVIDVVVGMVRQRFGSGQVEASEWLGDKFDSAPTLIEPVADALEKAAERVAATAAALDPEPEPVVVTSAVVEPELELELEPELEPEPELTPMQQIEQFSVPEEIGKQAGGLKSSADLPLADFDHMSAPQLRGRLRRLDRVQLVQLLDYERAHADRVGIVLLLENRLAKLIAADTDPGAPAES